MYPIFVLLYFVLILLLLLLLIFSNYKAEKTDSQKT